MNEDTALILKRKREDRTRAALKSFDPEGAPRLAPAVRAAWNLLVAANGRAVRYSTLVSAMLRASDVAVQTCETQISNWIAVGWLEKHGSVVRGSRNRARSDSRAYSALVDPRPPNVK